MPDSFPSSAPFPLPSAELWILGAGRFGRLAARRLARRFPHVALTVVDLRPEKLDCIREELGGRIALREQDALSFLTEIEHMKDNWIIPAVPVHVAFQWLLNRLRQIGYAEGIPVPEPVDYQVPNPYRVASGTVYTSYATFRCPDNCSEPHETCTFTGKPRPGNLFEQLEKIHVPGIEVAVLRSRQLAPGVGGYPGEDLFQMLHGVVQRAGTHLIATSCRCHGVLDAFHWSPA